jgi:replicative DNA helicase
MADLENLLIAKVIESGDFTTVVESRITTEQLIDPEHQQVFVWVNQHWTKYGSTPTRQAFRRQWPNYALPDTPEPLDYYVDEVKEQHKYDTITLAVQSAVETLAEDGGKVENTIADLTIALGEVQSTSSRLRDHNLTDPEEFSGRYDFYEELTKNPGALRGLSTGFHSIDMATMGYQPGQLITFVGPVKSGKSSILLVSADHVQRAGFATMLVSFEMGYSEQEARWVGIRAGLNYRRLLKGGMNDNDRKKLDKVLDDLSDNEPSKLILSEDISSTTTVSGLAAKLMLHKPEILFVDGVYLMDDENGEPKGSSQALTNITRSLKRLAQTFNIPIVISTQTLFSKMRGGKTVSASSVGYSSSFGQDADTLIGIEPRDTEDGDVEHWLKVLLSRSGPLMEVEIDFNWSISKFTELGAPTDYDPDLVDD